MRIFPIASAALLMSAPLAFAQAAAPAGSSPLQQQMVVDWAEYSTACRGGAVDGSRETRDGYCGTAQYLAYRLSAEGICVDTSVRSYFSKCAPGSIADPLEGYPF